LIRIMAKGPDEHGLGKVVRGLQTTLSAQDRR